jgi:hypothetical protein
MIAIGVLFVRMLCDYLKPRPQLEAEIVILRHQLNLLQRRAPRRPHLRWVDRALFIWVYRRCPRPFAPSPSLGPRPSCVGIAWVLPLTGDGSLVRPVADRGSPKRCAS